MLRSGCGEHCLKMPGPYLLRFGSESVLKILRKRMSLWHTQCMAKDVCRTAPVTPGLVIISPSANPQVRVPLWAGHGGRGGQEWLLPYIYWGENCEYSGAGGRNKGGGDEEKTVSLPPPGDLHVCQAGLPLLQEWEPGPGDTQSALWTRRSTTH